MIHILVSFLRMLGLVAKRPVDVCESAADMVAAMQKYTLRVVPSLDGRTWFCERVEYDRCYVNSHYVRDHVDPVRAVAAWLAIYGENPSHGLVPGSNVVFDDPRPVLQSRGVVLQAGKIEAIVAFPKCAPMPVELCKLRKEVALYVPQKLLSSPSSPSWARTKPFVR